MVALKNQSESGIEVVPQVLSKSAGEIIWLAQVCEQLGFKELNWNLGCPYPQVANKKRGSGILLILKWWMKSLQRFYAVLTFRFR
ncbi:MAG: tRNA-dihydrouridine synthase [Bacteroidales bacterium]|nr:tRNA-dihydrouridine synthase [Bacteroidales bacterium]